MPPSPLSTSQHPWDISTAEAKQLQVELAKQVIVEDQLTTKIQWVAGTDVGFEDDNRITRGVVVLLSFPELELVEYRIAKRPTTFPYIPGYLSFRECTVLLQALDSLKQCPDVMLCDGQGIAHPRRLGIACHLGVLTGLPTIGVAKSKLTGHYFEPGVDKGDWQPLEDKQETLDRILEQIKSLLPQHDTV